MFQLPAIFFCRHGCTAQTNPMEQVVPLARHQSAILTARSIGRRVGNIDKHHIPDLPYLYQNPALSVRHLSRRLISIVQQIGKQAADILIFHRIQVKSICLTIWYS